MDLSDAWGKEARIVEIFVERRPKYLLGLEWRGDEARQGILQEKVLQRAFGASEASRGGDYG